MNDLCKGSGKRCVSEVYLSPGLVAFAGTVEYHGIFTEIGWITDRYVYRSLDIEVQRP